MESLKGCGRDRPKNIHAAATFEISAGISAFSAGAPRGFGPGLAWKRWQRLG
jgi:hypothetical protein